MLVVIDNLEYLVLRVLAAGHVGDKLLELVLVFEVVQEGALGQDDVVNLLDFIIFRFGDEMHGALLEVEVVKVPKLHLERFKLVELGLDEVNELLEFLRRHKGKLEVDVRRPPIVGLIILLSDLLNGLPHRLRRGYNQCGVERLIA